MERKISSFASVAQSAQNTISRGDQEPASWTSASEPGVAALPRAPVPAASEMMDGNEKET